MHVRRHRWGLSTRAAQVLVKDDGLSCLHDKKTQKDPKKRGKRTIASRVFTRKPQTTHVWKSFSQHTFTFSLALLLSHSLALFVTHSLALQSLALWLSQSLALLLLLLSHSRSACHHNQDGIDDGCQLVLREQAMAGTRTQWDSTHTLTHTLSHIHTHTIAATRSLLSHTHSLSHTYTHTSTRTHTHVCTRAFVLLARSLTLSLTHT